MRFNGDENKSASVESRVSYINQICRPRAQNVPIKGIQLSANWKKKLKFFFSFVKLHCKYARSKLNN